MVGDTKQDVEHGNSPVTNAQEVTNSLNSVPSHYVLRILSGPHSGAEIDLTEASISLGKGADCDVVLMDSSLQDKHAELFVKDNQVQLNISDNAHTVIDGSKRNGSITLTNFQAITLGTTLVSTGPSDVTWPTITASQANATGPEESSQSDLNEPSTPPLDSDPAEESAATTDSDNKNTKKRSKLKTTLNYLILTLIIIGVFSIFGLAMMLTSNSDETSQAQAKQTYNKASIVKILEKNNVKSNNFTLTQAQDNFSITAYVETNDQKQALIKAFSSIPLKNLRVYSQENLVAQTQEIIKPLKTITVHKTKDLNTLALRGYYYAIDQLPNLQNKILTEVIGLKSIQTTLMNPEEVYNMASNVLSKHGLMGLLHLQTVPQGLVISGQIPPQNVSSWKQTKELLLKQFHGICSVSTNVSVLHHQSVKRAFFNSPILSVSIPPNGTPWIDLENGERYFEGTTLPSSYFIQSITPNGIILTKNAELINFNFSEI